MKKIFITVMLAISFLIASTLITGSSSSCISKINSNNNRAYAASGHWEWSTSESAAAFVDSMTNSEDGILYSNFPMQSWTVKIYDREKFNSIVNNRNYLRNFIAKRVWNVCMSDQKDKSKCYSSRDFLRKSWVIENDNIHFDTYEFALVLYKVDADNWFTFDRVRTKIAQYLEKNYGDRMLRLYKGFKHNGILAKGGISIEDLPVVIDIAEQTITFYSAELYD